MTFDPEKNTSISVHDYDTITTVYSNYYNNPCQSLVITADSITIKDKHIGLDITLSDNLSNVLDKLETIVINGQLFVKQKL